MRLAFLVALSFLAAGNSAARACNVPVFRYALERWNKRDADELYSLHVFHHGPCPADVTRALDDLETLLEKQMGNLLVYRIDVAKPLRDPRIAHMAQKQAADARAKDYPYMVLSLPAIWGFERPLYAGPFDARRVDAWLDSPLRQRFARLLLRGHSGVFLLIESGDAKKDEEKAAFVEARLAELQKEMTLPERTEAPKDALLRPEIPLKIDFAFVRLSRKDAAETLLLDMLCAMDRDESLATEKEPVLLAIYGRGIAMVNESLIGKGINANHVKGLVRFLLGPCTCELRRGNPGIELLTNVNWDEPAPAEPTEATSTTSPADTDATFVCGENGEPSSIFQVWRNVVWIFGGVLVAVLVGTMLVVGRRGKTI